MKTAVCAFLLAGIQLFALPAALPGEEPAVSPPPVNESGIETEDLPVVRMLDLLQLMELLQDLEMLQENSLNSISEDE